ncbi:uncharacterized protein ASCRUDRAFT_78282 [Ascoidea rubescens DSM 1968]|uniref:Uncharacterized protein n=1 Tax=Ascoidea rubescens DSM 1968 TaxID=1344418 RepID=A0A1D2V8A5_9ASCO|nr:hypothetical protein ASCRUDRAFT_78282 [Ascoidea rubescens DSM 1968]ODV57911.1 hypothetical protein ASCRUDRAFT_78282 [Ascoidea rubescens DSM 1968]
MILKFKSKVFNSLSLSEVENIFFQACDEAILTLAPIEKDQLREMYQVNQNSFNKHKTNNPNQERIKNPLINGNITINNLDIYRPLQHEEEQNAMKLARKAGNIGMINGRDSTKDILLLLNSNFKKSFGVIYHNLFPQPEMLKNFQTEEIIIVVFKEFLRLKYFNPTALNLTYNGNSSKFSSDALHFNYDEKRSWKHLVISFTYIQMKPEEKNAIKKWVSEKQQMYNSENIDHKYQTKDFPLDFSEEEAKLFLNYYDTPRWKVNYKFLCKMINNLIMINQKSSSNTSISGGESFTDFERSSRETDMEINKRIISQLSIKFYQR